MPPWAPLSPRLLPTYTWNFFKELALESAPSRPSLWKRYVCQLHSRPEDWSIRSKRRQDKFLCYQVVYKRTLNIFHGHQHCQQHRHVTSHSGYQLPIRSMLHSNSTCYWALKATMDLGVFDICFLKFYSHKLGIFAWFHDFIWFHNLIICFCAQNGMCAQEVILILSCYLPHYQIVYVL